MLGPYKGRCTRQCVCVCVYVCVCVCICVFMEANTHIFIHKINFVLN